MCQPPWRKKKEKKKTNIFLESRDDFFCFVLLAAGMEGGEEGERRGVTVTVFCLIGYW